LRAAEVLSVAAFLSGRCSQAFPSFGSERAGAPVLSFCRIDSNRIRTREPVQAPDALIVQDATLLHHRPCSRPLPIEVNVLPGRVNELLDRFRGLGIASRLRLTLTSS